MLIGQVIQNVFPIAPSSDDVVGTQNAKPLGDDGDGLTFDLSQFGDAGLSLREPSKQPDSRWLAEGPEDSRCAFNSRFVHRQLKPLRSVTVGGAERF